MSSGLLPDHIGPLVDRLRTGDHLPIALPDVAAVTEVLMRSLESYFKSIDLTLYKECQDLADYIENARTEISSLSPEHEDSAGIPRAGLELDAIVEATESATETIMQASEDIMSFDSSDFDEYKNHINNEIMKIFEACSFQDITGQRISKVVKTLNHVEDRVGKLISILGLSTIEATSNNKKPIVDPEQMTDEDLLNGPALAGEGIDQGAVDSLLDNFDPIVSDKSPMAEENEQFDEAANQTIESTNEDTNSENLNTENEPKQAIDETIQENEPFTSETAENESDQILKEKKPHDNVSAKAPTNNNTNNGSILKKNVVETSQEDIDNLFG